MATEHFHCCMCGKTLDMGVGYNRHPRPCWECAVEVGLWWLHAEYIRNATAQDLHDIVDDLVRSIESGKYPRSG